MARIRGVSTHRCESLTDWQVATCDPDAVTTPEAAAQLRMLPLRAPGSLASALRDAGELSQGQPRDLDAVDAWFRCRLPDLGESPLPRWLCLDAFSGQGELFVDGERQAELTSDFVAHRFSIPSAAREIAIRVRALSRLLAARRPRPRWRTRLVAQQNLRWHRVSLLGRMPGWYPPLPLLGPVGPARLELCAGLSVERADVRAGLEGHAGVVTARLEVTPEAGSTLRAAHLCVGDVAAPLGIVAGDGRAELSGSARLPAVARWWPHTHGAQPRFEVTVELDTSHGPCTIDLGHTAFRALTVDRRDHGFSFVMNGTPVFCRGAVWSPMDAFVPHVEREAQRAALLQFRDAGFNMVRVGGTMRYESADFHDLCDELGLLVWQDLMFASMDYPVDDPAFRAAAAAEAAALADSQQLSPSLALYCGSSEVEQQAAMLGLPAETWRGALLEQVLPEALAASRPDIAYIPSSPTGGALPFHPGAGVAHYYGVGAYLRPLDDARRAGVRFAGECLAFANVPRRETVQLVLGDGEAAPHHPAWKARVPRDRGPGWDFDDVRDHYLRALFAVDPAALRYADAERYLELGRVTSGEVMARTFSEWRRPGSGCGGALVWLWRDPWPGAGWGLVDATGWAKPALAILARVLRPQALLLLDEGTGGLMLHAVNDGPQTVIGELTVSLWQAGHVRVADASQAITVPPHGAFSLGLDEVFGRFTDAGWAYRFGPPSCDLVVAEWRAADRVLSRITHQPLGLTSAREEDVGLEASLSGEGDDLRLTVSARRFAAHVAVDAPGFCPDDDYFAVPPGGQHTLRLRRVGATPAPHTGRVTALNAHAAARFSLPKG